MTHSSTSQRPCDPVSGKAFSFEKAVCARLMRLGGMSAMWVRGRLECRMIERSTAFKRDIKRVEATPRESADVDSLFAQKPDVAANR